MTSKMTSPRHPNWIIEKENNTYGMYHKDFQGYFIPVTKNSDGKWYGEIYTEQKVSDMVNDTEWLPAQMNPMYAPLAEVKAEVIKRGQYWASKNN